MKLWTAFFVALLVCAGSPKAHAVTQSNSASANLPGRAIAENISLITGVAISPLMGVAAVGAYQYFKAKTPAERAKLAWYTHPMFWVPALILVVACFAKDTAGTALPTAVKKPLDVAETIEHKISGLVATGAFVPIAASIFHAGGGDGASLSAAGFAAIDLSWFYNAIMIPVSMAAFFIVCLASNAINVLILLSPFTTVDAALKVFRLAILATVAGSAWINPWIGAAWALIVIGFAWLISGWSFRLSHFGLAFVWDFVTLRSRRFKPDPFANKMFLGRQLSKVPARTYGRLGRDAQSKLTFCYRPWLVLPARLLEVPEVKLEAGRGVFYSEILRIEGAEAKTVFLLPPRYRGHEEQVARIYGFAGVRDVGLRAAWKWFRELFTNRAQLAAA